MSAQPSCYTPRVRALLLIVGALSACALDARDLDAFRTTARGPQKLRAVLRSEDRTPALRALAALNLLDLTRKDVDGRALLFEDLNALDARERSAIVPALEASLTARMRTSPGQPPAPAAVQAKDAQIKLLALLDESERAPLGTAVLAWITEDMPRRADCGGYSLERLAELLGPRSAPPLIAALREDHAAESVARIAAVVDAHAEPTFRAPAAERLIALEQAYRARSLAGPEARLLAERELGRSLLPALARFADQPAARVRLVQVARDERVVPAQRTQALELLEGHGTAGEVQVLLALAQLESSPPELRLLAVARAGETRSRDALPGLLIVLANREHPELRRRAGELILEIGGTEVVPSFLRSLPSAWDMPFEKREIDAYGERLARLPADPGLSLLLGNKLHSSFWYHRVLALRYLAAHTALEDIWRIRNHVYDPQPVFGAGWPKGHTVGLEAESALAQAGERVPAAASKSGRIAPAQPAGRRPLAARPAVQPAQAQQKPDDHAVHSVAPASAEGAPAPHDQAAESNLEAAPLDEPSSP